MSDPRAPYRPSPRDLAAGRFIGEGYEVSQYELREAVFAGRARGVVSRFVTRWRSRELLHASRFQGWGMNRLRLTSKGRDVLLAHGADRRTLFVPKKPVALKDLAHHLWINDLRVVLAGEGFPKTLPSWAIERLFPAWPVSPDLLALRPASGGRQGLALAVEVDLGGEGITKVFAPKLGKLQEHLASVAGGDGSGVLVVTSGARRAEAIAKATEGADADVPLWIGVLPASSGSAGLLALRGLCRGAVDALARSRSPKL